MSTTVTRPDDAATTRKSFLGTGIGNALEWYDWNVYTTMSAYIAAHLFDSHDPSSAVLKTLAVFAVGFVARPIGGLLFGLVADLRGRKFSLMLSVAVASFGSLIIALTPDYDRIGVFASILLLLARLLQGLAHGGELPAAQTYLAEKAPAERRGLWSSWIYTSGTIGNVVGLLLGAVLATVLSKDAMDGWGWRIPFFVGALIGLYALVLRRSMTESEVFTAEVGQVADVEKEPVWRSLLAHWKQALQVIGMTAGATIVYYSWAVNAPAYAQNTLHIDRAAAMWAGLAANLAFIVCLPLYGTLSDRIGRKPVILWAILGGAVLNVPLTAMLKDSAWQLLLTMTIMLVVISAYSAIAPAAYAEMFSTNVRAAGFGLPYSIAIAAFGGTAPLLQAWMAERWGTGVFPWYAVIALVLTAIVVVTLPETKGIDLHEEAGQRAR